jgi:dTDP-4-dehydrorhamnose 3,5-epimerase
MVEILKVFSLAIPEIKVIRFRRFRDSRGYFAETLRRSDIIKRLELSFFSEVDFTQCNESCSKTGVLRGLHFQWEPYMGKLVRTVTGRMVDMVADIRLGSPHLGKVILYDMPANAEMEWGEWIWIPPGFAHGNFFLEETILEYFCSGDYNPSCEAGISPLADDLDWSLCDTGLRRLFLEYHARGDWIMSERDRAGQSVASWLADPRSKQFIIGDLEK